MKKLLVVLLALLICGSAYALNETGNGPQNITSCWMVGTDAMTSGNVVVLQTSSPTYYGREVTGCSTAGLGIYGVVVDTTNYTPAQMHSGQWVRVQTYGYCPIVKLASLNAAVTATTSSGTLTELSNLVTSDEAFKCTSCAEASYAGAGDSVSTNTVALETNKSDGVLGSQPTIKAWLNW